MVPGIQVRIPKANRVAALLQPLRESPSRVLSCHHLKGMVFCHSSTTTLYISNQAKDVAHEKKIPWIAQCWDLLWGCCHPDYPSLAGYERKFPLACGFLCNSFSPGFLSPPHTLTVELLRKGVSFCHLEGKEMK